MPLAPAAGQSRFGGDCRDARMVRVDTATVGGGGPMVSEVAAGAAADAIGGVLGA